MSDSIASWARAVLSNKKTFNDTALGRPRQNRLGLHCARILLSDGLHAAQLAYSLLTAKAIPERVIRAVHTLRRDGFVAIPNYLPEPEFQALRGECRKRSGEIHAEIPLTTNLKPGTGHNQRFKGGVDRYDGATTNRFIDLDAGRTPLTLALTEDPRFQSYRRLLNANHHPLDLKIYENIHGDESTNHDVQKDIHRDTFHHTYKLWFYLDDVHEEHGPFQYCATSHRMNLKRLRWEYDKSNEAASGSEKGGAFRATKQQLLALGLPADAIHRRGAQHAPGR
jgi:hypothetical protein